MYIDEKIDSLQNLTKRKITYDEIAKALGLGSGQAVRNRKSRKQPLKKYEIDIIDKVFANEINQNKSFEEENTLTLTYYPDVYLSAGYGVEIYDEVPEKMTLDARLFVTERGNKINPANCEIVKVSGNSMYPEYRHGDRVIIDRSDIELMDGQIYAFRYKKQCYVKEINLLGNRIKCISLNKEYDPFYIEMDEDFIVLGRILPRIRL